MRFIDPRTDFAFKKIFGNENAKEILISFLNAVLDLKKGLRICEVEILNPYQAPKLKFVKETYVDVRCVDERGIWYIAEMQVQYVKGFEKRVIYNSSKAYINQIEKGDAYPKLRQVLSISILDFEMFDDIDRYLTLHILKEDLHNRCYIDEIRYYFIELPKFTKGEEEIESPLEKWVFFIKNAGSLEAAPAKLDQGEYKKAFEIANAAGMSREEWTYYDAASMKIQDEKGAIEAAYEKGERKGIEQGMEKGIEKGIEQGKRDDLLSILEIRFGAVPDDIQVRVKDIEDKAALNELLTAAIKSEDMERFREVIVKRDEHDKS